MPVQAKLDRSQIQFFALDQIVEAGSIVRIFDLFCQCIDYEDLGFRVKGKSHEGKPALEASTLTAIYIYGYLHKIRSCRLLAKACKVNTELWWLTGMQKPGYKTIADFRKENSEAFKNLFKSFSKFCLELDLYGKTTVAIDGSKFRAQNSKKNNYNLKKINQHLVYISQQKQDYLETLESNDKADDTLMSLQLRENKYQQLKNELEASGETQISTTDKDARALPIKMSIVEVAYNLQSVVDDKHNLIIDYEVTNKNDFSALAPLSISARQALQLKEEDTLTVLADKGYYSGKQIAICHENNIDTLVAPKSKSSKAKDKRVGKDKFSYDKKTDSYTCPKNATLHRQGKVYSRQDGIPFKRYVAHWSDCKDCPWVDICVSPGSQKASRGRMLNRNIYENQMDVNDAQVNARKTEYRRRQAIVEHPFEDCEMRSIEGSESTFKTKEPKLQLWVGSKRQWGYTHTHLKSLKKVNGEFGLVLLCYNLKRILSIMGLKSLKEALITRNSSIMVISAFIKHHIECAICSPHHSPHNFSLN